MPTSCAWTAARHGVVHVVGKIHGADAHALRQANTLVPSDELSADVHHYIPQQPQCLISEGRNT